mmetsp:Transcript_34594/g.98425  ORF Transcript_34594/g.98425 Transcript_34594/m.98425 type:complete len:230 (-) Transcript_34594:125-814(-)
MSNMSTLNYPRTGKRGVPQQFPRRLYEMLESEAKLAVSKPDEVFVVSWSGSGKAFRITDVDEFAGTVLPKYFRTKKFSSFQRNLNLYGFTKVRRGPDTDMYAHPSFLRCQPDLLSELRKSTSASRRRVSRTPSEASDSSASSGSGSPSFRSVSPTSPRYRATYFQPIAQKGSGASELVSSPQCVTQTWVTFKAQPMMLPKAQVLQPRKEATGRLDLLALVIERESCLSA